MQVAIDKNVQKEKWEKEPRRDSNPGLTPYAAHPLTFAIRLAAMILGCRFLL